MRVAGWHGQTPFVRAEHARRYLQSGVIVLLLEMTIVAFFALATAAISYFFTRIKLFSFALVLFYACNVFLSYSLLSGHHFFLFYVITAFFVFIPLFSLMLFAMDVHFALFCTDTSFILVIVWLFSPAFFIVNIFMYILKILHA